VLSAEQLDEVEDYARYKDTDGDGICYRTLPGTHPDKGAFFTRGTSRNEYAGYTEKSAEYVANMDRLNKKFATASALVPQPEITEGKKIAPVGLIYFGTSSHAIDESRQQLKDHGLAIDTLRIKAFPFNEKISQFIERHANIFVIEQNRDGQMRALLMNELTVDPARLNAILNYDGLPVTSTFIVEKVLGTLARQQKSQVS